MPKTRVNFLLQYLGFVINLKKCLIIPNQKTEFLDLIINSVKLQTGINVVDRKSKINNWKVSYNTNRRIIDRREAICLGDCKMNLVLLAIEIPHKLSRIAAVKKKNLSIFTNGVNTFPNRQQGSTKISIENEGAPGT